MIARRLGFGLVVSVSAILLTPPGGVPPAAASDQRPPAARFRLLGELVDRRADWVAMDGHRIAFGSGTRLHVGETTPLMRVTSVADIAMHVTDAVLVSDDLYVTDGTRLGVLDIRSPHLGLDPISLVPAPRGTLRLARMPDHLVVAEEGLGLRFVALRLTGDHGHHGQGRPDQVALLPLPESFAAVASSNGFVYAATSNRRIAVIDVANLDGPGAVEYLDVEEPVHALAADGSTLYLLGPSGLRVTDVSPQGGAFVTSFHREIRGESLQIAGRSVLVASGDRGLASMSDPSVTAATHNVTVGDFFFTPSLVNAAPGDTVAWTNPGSVFPHNVRSCTPAEFGCGGASATENFFSGAATTAFTFSHTFTLAGSNPYVCQIHATTMTGNVMVSVATPPGVPDGSAGSTPVTVNKITSTGSTLDVFFDTSTCSAVNHQIVYGEGSQLPASPGGVYDLKGGECLIGTTSPFTWNAVPDAADGTGLIWFLVLANDGATSEGSWGKASSGAERNGTGVNGSSAQCGITDKKLTNTCGQ